MPGSKIDVSGIDPDLFAQWITARSGGDFQANRVAAHDVWARAGDSEALQDYFGTGEVLDDLLDFLEEHHKKPSTNPQPKKPGKNGKYARPMWIKPPSKLQQKRLGFMPEGFGAVGSMSSEIQ